MPWLHRCRWRLLAAIAVILVAIAVGWSRMALFRVNQKLFDDKVASASNAASIEQTFASHFPGLSTMVFELVEPFPPGDQPVSLRLVDLSPGESQTLALSGPLSQFQAKGELRFSFAPLDDSAGRPYRLIITTQGAVPLRLRAHHLDAYPAGELAGGGDLMFDVRYNGRVAPSVLALLPRLAENKPGLFGQPWLYVVLGLAYGLILLMVLIRLAPGGPVSRGEPAAPEPDTPRVP